jgi:FkbM family methyltransferase
VRRSRLVKTKAYPLLVAYPHDIIGREVLLYGLYEEPLLCSLLDKVVMRAIPDLKNSVALDIGANIGNHALMFSRYFGQVVAFEPNPPTFKFLEGNILLNGTENIVALPIGLSDQNAELSFYDYGPDNLGASGFRPHPDTDWTPRMRNLCVRNGDEVLADVKLAGPISMVKLDVEGHELRALKGIEKTLLANNPIILFETNGAGGEAGSDSIWSYLRSLGYAHLYLIEKKESIAPTFFKVPLLRGIEKVVRRIVLGANWFLFEVPELADRPYALVIASRQPIPF